MVTSRTSLLASLLLLVPLGLLAQGPGKGDRPNPYFDGLTPFRRVIRCIAHFDGSLWFGTYGNGLYQRVGRRWVRHFAAITGLAEDRVNCLAPHEGTLWVGTCLGLTPWSGGAFGDTVRAGPGSVAHDIYHVVEELPVGGLWVGTTGKGVSVLRDGTWTTYDRRHGLMSGWVNDFHADEDGTVYVATGSGLYSGPEGKWRIHEGKGTPPPLETEITALASQGNKLWVGTMLEGLWLLQRDFWIHIPREDFPSRQVLALAPDPEGNLWLGTPEGLFRYHLRTGFQPVPAATGIPRQEVKVLHVDEGGTLRVGTLAGKLYERVPPAPEPEAASGEGLAGSPREPGWGRFELLFDPAVEASPGPPLPAPEPGE